MSDDAAWRKMRRLVRAERYLNWLLLLSLPVVAWRLITLALAGEYVHGAITLVFVYAIYRVWRWDPPMITIHDEDDI